MCKPVKTIEIRYTVNRYALPDNPTEEIPPLNQEPFIGTQLDCNKLTEEINKEDEGYNSTGGES